MTNIVKNDGLVEQFDANKLAMSIGELCNDLEHVNVSYLVEKIQAGLPLELGVDELIQMAANLSSN